MENLTIVVNIIAKADRIDFVKKELLKIIEETRAEEGCVRYDLHQDNKNPDHFLFYEQWASRDFWQKHMASQHLEDHMGATKDAIEKLTLNEMTHIA